MVATLHTHQISHGDLQDGNILLKRNGADVGIKLIDYDSLFVPKLRGQPDTILGLPEYQHPQRQAGTGVAREKVDYFSELVIYLSFVALAEKPELWGQFGVRTEKGLLFTAVDFRNPHESEVFRELENLSPNVRQLASKLKDFCAKQSIDHLEPLEAVVPIPDFLASVWKLLSKNKLATVLAVCVIAFFMQMNAKNGAVRQNQELENQLLLQGTELKSLESKNQELSSDNKTLANLLDGKWYKVKKGDTLSGIARKHNVSWPSIMNANPKLKSGPPFQPGQKIFIPGPRAIGFKAPLPDPDQIALAKENTKLRGKNQTLQNDNQKLRLDNAALKKKLDEGPTPNSKQVGLKTENAKLLRENRKLRLENSAFKKQLEKLEGRNAQQVVSIPPIDGNNDIMETTHGALNSHQERGISGKLLHRLTGHTGLVYRVAFSPDGQTLASGSWDDTVRLWDGVLGMHRRTLIGHTSAVCGVVFSPDGRTLASGSYDRTIRLWDGITGAHRRTLAGHKDWVYAVTFSPDGDTLASGSDDKTIFLWDVATGRHRQTLTGHTAGVNTVAYSPDGLMFASGGMDNTIRLWDALTGAHQRTLAGHRDWVYAITFSPDGRTLASASWDHTIRLWDASTGAHEQTLTGHTAGVYCVAFSPNGQTLASASWDRTIRLWDAASGNHKRTLIGHTAGVYCVAFSPDGRKLASASWDHTIRLID